MNEWIGIGNHGKHKLSPVFSSEEDRTGVIRRVPFNKSAS